MDRRARAPWSWPSGSARRWWCSIRTDLTARLRAAAARVPEGVLRREGVHARTRCSGWPSTRGSTCSPRAAARSRRACAPACRPPGSRSTAGTSPTTSWRWPSGPACGLVIADGAGRAAAAGRVRGRGGRRAAVPAPREPRPARRHARVDRDRPRVDGVRRAARPPCRRRSRTAAPLAHLGSWASTRTSDRRSSTTEPFMRELDVLVALTVRLREQHGIAVELLDMGGGFGITYTDETPPSIAEIGGCRGAPPADPVRRAGSPRADAGGRARPEHRRATPGSRCTGWATAGPWATVGP